MSERRAEGRTPRDAVRRRVLWMFTGGAFSLLLVRCSSFESAPAEPELDGSVVDVAAPPLDASVVDAFIGCDPTCPGDAGPCAVRVESSCIDATEVTIGQFKAFANAMHDKGFDAGKPCPLVKPATIGNVLDEDLPMTSVDMCSARAYCAWAGKHLCGATDGGAVVPKTETTQASAWFHACTGSYDLVATHFVNDVPCRLDAGGAVEVGTTCQGGVPGLSEMVGNVWEWIDETIPTDGAAPQGYIVGGSYVNRSADCKSLLRSTDIGLRSADIGFRCCSP